MHRLAEQSQLVDREAVLENLPPVILPLIAKKKSVATVAQAVREGQAAVERGRSVQLRGRKTLEHVVLQPINAVVICGHGRPRKDAWVSIHTWAAESVPPEPKVAAN